jgi:uncharacterized protein YbjQ (UPF0145 family)
MGFLIFLALLVIGYLFGRLAEQRHYRSIHEREDALRRITVIPLRVPPPELLKHESQLVSGNVVISIDYFKTVAAGLRNLFGGRVGAYESLIDRARREATLRMQEKAQSLGAQTVYNVKYETSRIGDNAGQGLGSVEVLAYGTALTAPSVKA